MSTSLREFIESSAWGSQLGQADLARVLATAREVTVAKDCYVVRQGDLASHWTGLIEGLVLQMITNPDGQPTVLTAAGTRSWFGEGTLMRGGRWGYDAVARRHTRVALVPRATFQWLLDTSLPFNQFIARLLNERLSLYMGMLAGERLTTIEERTAHVLASLFNPVLYPDGVRTLQINQADIGLLVGLSRQRVNTALQELQDAGLIRLGRSTLTVLDPAALREYQRS